MEREKELKDIIAKKDKEEGHQEYEAKPETPAEEPKPPPQQQDSQTCPGCKQHVSNCVCYCEECGQARESCMCFSNQANQGGAAIGSGGLGEDEEEDE